MVKALAPLPQQLPADQNPALVYIAGLSAGSRRTQLAALQSVADELSKGKADIYSFPWHLLRYQHVQALRSRMLEIVEIKPATINRYLSAVRRVLKEAWRLDLITTDDYMKACDVENVPHTSLPKGRAVEMNEMKALLQTCLLDESPIGIRDAAILSVMFVAGLRRFEIQALNTEDFDVKTGAVTVLKGKRNKSRVMYLEGHAKQHVLDWLKVRGTKPGALFNAIDRHGLVAENRLGSQGIYDMIRRRSRQANLEASPSPHDFRRTMISEMLDRGVDVVTVADIAGHEDLNTTRRYDRRGEKRKQDAAKTLDTPI